MNLVPWPRFWVKESNDIIFRMKKVAAKGEFQDGRQMAAAPFRLAYQGL